MNALRADQVGSLLRPSELLQARVDCFAERLDRNGLRAEEDRAILEALRRQRDCGMDVLTDGEFRRSSSSGAFVHAVQGLVEGEPADLPWKGGRGSEGPSASSRIVVTGRLRGRGRIADVEAAFLREHAHAPFKVTLPSPLLLALTGFRPGVTDGAYPSREELIADAAAILADEARQLATEGVPYIQVDSTAYTHWLDHSLVAWHRERGVDTDSLLDAAIKGDNRILDAARKAGAITAVHLCRGNSMGRWLAEGPYDPIAEMLFQRLRCHRLLLEFDSPRAGDLAVLRYVPAGRVAVLGLISTKTGVLEDRDDLLRRIDRASRILPLEQLALSPQCGFATGLVGNPLTMDEQWRKLELVASLAREVWP